MILTAVEKEDSAAVRIFFGQNIPKFRQKMFYFAA